MDQVRLAVVAALLAGCGAPPAAPDDAQPDLWQAAECDPSGATTIGANAPPVDGLVGSQEEVAARVAQAFGDSLVDPEPIDETESFARWSTTTGFVQVSRDDRLARWSVTTSRGDFPSLDRLRQGLQDLGAPPDSLQADPSYDGMLHQTWKGTVVGGTSASFLKGHGDPAPMGSYGSFDLGGLIRPPGPLATLPEADLVATARAYDDCAMAAEGRTPDAGYLYKAATAGGYAVQHGSLVLEVFIEYEAPEEGHCEYRRGVAVDLVTGAVHGPVPALCA